jgi:hypothetical protein
MVKGAVGERPVGVPPPRRVLQGPEERPVRVLAVAGGLEVLVDALQGKRVSRHVPHFTPLTQDAQVGHALAALQVAHAQAAQFFAPQPVVEEGGQDRPVAFALEACSRVFHALANLADTCTLNLGAVDPQFPFPS